MADKPLLLFPSYSRVSSELRPGGAGTEFHKPDKIKQTARIGNMFSRVSTAFEKHRALVTASADGLTPEMVLVFETRGSVEEFFKAVKQIPQLKWLGEYETEFDSTEDFKYDDDSKLVPGKLFFLLADNAAVKELGSLWNTWKSKKQRFKTGLAKWKQLFNHLVDIRPWGFKDRILETGILKDIEHRIAEGEEVVPFEIELWYRKSAGYRKENAARVRALVAEYDGIVLSECEINEISYHALLVKAPVSIFQELTEENSIKFFKSTDIMHIRPVGQSVSKNTGIVDAESVDLNIPASEQILPSIIGLLDGVPVQNHAYLQERINFVDPDGFEENYPVQYRKHCTVMASLIIHGDLNDNNVPLKSRLLIRPVMRYYDRGLGYHEESLPENTLWVDLIHRAVREIVKGNGEAAPIAPTVKIINLSLGDSYRVFDGMMSSLARLIDWLSEEYNILFIVSAGNFLDDIECVVNGVPSNEIINNPENLYSAFISHCYNKNRFRKIISPAESINALTVGAAHDDSSAYNNAHLINIHNNAGMLSPLSRMGLGFRKSIKPEILAKGGRLLYRDRGNGLLGIPNNTNRTAPGLKVAAPGDGGNKVIFEHGTSNAAALTSNVAGKIYEAFLEDDQLREALTGDFFAVTAKALLVHSSSWDQVTMDAITANFDSSLDKRELVSRFLGYGKIEPYRILECTDKRVTLIAIEKIKPESAHVYDLPLPEILEGTTNWRKLAVTLAYMSPINTSNQLYRSNKLWFDFPGKGYDTKLKAKRLYYDDDSVRRGTVQHEIFFSDQAQVFQEEPILKIKVNCKNDAAKYNEVTLAKDKNIVYVRYALVVTLEIDEAIEGNLYQLISDRIRQAQAIRQEI